MGKVNPDVKNLIGANMKKRLRPDTAFSVGSSFVQEVLEAFGDKLEDGATPKEGWRVFRPGGFILELQAVHDKFTSAGGGIKGHETLTEIERAICTDNGLLLGSLLNYALDDRHPEKEGEDRYQIPVAVAADLQSLCR